MRFSTRLSLLLALLMTACSTAVPEAAPFEELVVMAREAGATPTPEIMPTATLEPTPDAPAPGSVSYRGMRFSYDPTLASSVRGAVIPTYKGNTPDQDVPEHVRFIFDELGRSNTFNPREPHLMVFPVDEFRLSESRRSELVLAELDALLTERPLKLDREVFLIPSAEVQMDIQHNARYLRFESGEGVRFLASYHEEPGPVTNDTLFYTFQGLSADGQYYIAFYFPVETRLLPASADDLAEDDPYYSVSYDEYRDGIIQLLEEVPDQDFQPNLRLLDGLIKSLRLPDAGAMLPRVSDPEQITDRIRREGKLGLRALWRDLDISSGLFETASQLNLELFEMNVDGSQDEYRLLLVSDTLELDWQYLMFRSAGNRWLFVGNVDLSEQKYLPPACRIVNGKDGAWWVLTWLEDAGPNATQYRETWYRFSDDALYPVLDFPLEGYQVSPDYAYNVVYRGELAVEEEGVHDSFRLTYHLTYSINGDGEGKTTPVETYNLFEMVRSVVYNWDEQERRFVLSPDSSQLTQDQIDAVFYFPGPDAAFLEFAGEELSQLARSGSPLQKRWLTRFLESLESGMDVDEFIKQYGG